jgi:ribonuclease P protein component
VGLPPHRRLASSRDFQQTVREGRRAGAGRLVVHLWAPTADQANASDATLPAAKVGFVVSKAVGNAVVRHRVTRRLREIAATRVAGWPGGTRVVVRALPPAATASSAVLANELDGCLRRLTVGARP